MEINSSTANFMNLGHVIEHFDDLNEDLCMRRAKRICRRNAYCVGDEVTSLQVNKRKRGIAHRKVRVFLRPSVAQKLWPGRRLRKFKN